jgi:hypothetical protein
MVRLWSKACVRQQNEAYIIFYLSAIEQPKSVFVINKKTFVTQ